MTLWAFLLSALTFASESVSKKEICALALKDPAKHLSIKQVATFYTHSDADRARPEEAVAATQLAVHLRTKKQKVVLITSLKGRTIPALDGVIVDEANEPVLNFSIKSVKSSSQVRPIIEESIDQVVRYTRPQKWLESTNLFQADRYILSSDARKGKLEQVYEWLRTVFGIFGVESERQTLVFIHYAGRVTEQLTVADVGMIKKRINRLRFYQRRGLGDPIVSEVLIRDAVGFYRISVEP